MAIVRSIFTYPSLSLNHVGAFQIVSTIFMSCTSVTHGGAIFLNNSLSNITLYFCSFDKCSATGNGVHGGGICVYQSRKVLFHSTCFRDCIAYRCPGFILWENSYTTVYSRINLTSENNPYVTGAGSAYYAADDSLYSENNVSNSNTNDVSAGMFFGIMKNIVVARYFTICRASGNNGFVGFAVRGINSINTIEYANYISCHSNDAAFFCSTSNFLIVQNTIFSNCTFLRFVYVRPSITSYVTLLKCILDDIDQNVITSLCTLNDCSYTSQAILIPHKLFNTFLCWNDNEIVINTIANLSPHSRSLIWMTFLYFIG